jgi:hypothetical protein
MTRQVETSEVEPVKRQKCTGRSLIKAEDGSPLLDENGERQYKPCGLYPIKGSTVCHKHGASTPQVKRKAKEVLLELREPALAALAKVLRDPKADDSTKVRAALGILDRTGLGPGMKVEAEVTLQPWQQVLGRVAGNVGVELPEHVADQVEAMEVVELRREVRQLRAALRDGSIPGEVVQDADRPISRTSVRRELPAVPADEPESLAVHEDQPRSHMPATPVHADTPGSAEPAKPKRRRASDVRNEPAGMGRSPGVIKSPEDTPVARAKRKLRPVGPSEMATGRGQARRLEDRLGG